MGADSRDSELIARSLRRQSWVALAMVPVLLWSAALVFDSGPPLWFTVPVMSFTYLLAVLSFFQWRHLRRAAIRFRPLKVTNVVVASGTPWGEPDGGPPAELRGDVVPGHPLFELFQGAMKHPDGMTMAHVEPDEDGHWRVVDWDFGRETS